LGNFLGSCVLINLCVLVHICVFLFLQRKEVVSFWVLILSMETHLPPCQNNVGLWETLVALFHCFRTTLYSPTLCVWRYKQLKLGPNFNPQEDPLPSGFDHARWDLSQYYLFIWYGKCCFLFLQSFKFRLFLFFVCINIDFWLFF